MPDAFGERLRAGGIVWSQTVLEAWASAIQKFVQEGLSGAQLPDLARLAFQRSPTETETARALRAACNDATDEQEVHANDEFLLALLGCLALIQAFDGLSSRRQSVQAALLVRAASFNHWEPAHPDVFHEARRAIRREAVRSFASVAPPRVAGQTAATRQKLDALATADWGVYRQAIVDLSNEIQRLRNAMTRLATYVVESQQPLREQMELLWWTTSGYSLTAGRMISQLPADAAPCVAARDMARIAPRAPGPIAADALLAGALRHIRGAESPFTTVTIAARATRDIGAADEFPEVKDFLADFLPVLSAIKETNSELDDQSRSSLLISRQTYDELLMTNNEF